MSLYCQVATEFKDQQSLIAALMETGNWNSGQIEIHSEAQNLFGHTGDMRKDTAHIIIRRKYIGKLSNDIGFRRTDTGEFEAIISEYDRSKYGDQFIGRLKGNYAFRTVERNQKARGRTVMREKLPGGGQRIKIGGYR